MYLLMCPQSIFGVKYFSAYFAGGIYFIGMVDFDMLGKTQQRDKPFSTCVTKIRLFCVLVKFVAV